MEKKDDSVLFLLQDIKEILFGAALLLAGGALLELSSLDFLDREELLLILSLPVLALGAFHVWKGWTNHELIEKNEDSKEQGGSPCP